MSVTLAISLEAQIPYLNWHAIIVIYSTNDTAWIDIKVNDIETLISIHVHYNVLKRPLWIFCCRCIRVSQEIFQVIDIRSRSSTVLCSVWLIREDSKFILLKLKSVKWLLTKRTVLRSIIGCSACLMELVRNGWNQYSSTQLKSFCYGPVFIKLTELNRTLKAGVDILHSCCFKPQNNSIMFLR